MDIMSELERIGPSIRANDFYVAMDKIRDLWTRIPDPKVETSNAYLVIEYGVACALKIGDLDEAQRWASLAPDFSQKRQDRGEVEFLIGKVAYERGEFEVARENFIISNEKSGGRIFEGQDKRYRSIIE